MTIKDKSYITSRYNDFGWGLNVRDSSESIDNKQATLAVNVVSEGNKIMTIPGYSELLTLSTWASRWQAIETYDGSIYAIYNSNLYAYNISTQVTKIQLAAVSSTTDTYRIIITKSFSWGTAICLINTNSSTVEDVKVYEFDWTSFTPKTLTWLSNKNFKAWMWYEGRLFLGWNPLSPSVMYYSKVSASWLPDNMYNFSWYPSNAQMIGDWEAIVHMLTNHNEVFIVKKTSIHRITWEKDTTTAYAFLTRQETSTWAVNWFCVIPVEQDIIYFDWINLRRLSYEININSMNDDSISREITPFIASLPSSQPNATMWFAYPYVKLNLRDKFSQENALAVVYNIVDKSHTIQTWISWTQWAWGIIGIRRSCYFMDASSSKIYEDNKWDTYNWGEIFQSFITKFFSEWDSVDYKRISQCEIKWNVTPESRLYIDVWVDWNLITTKEIYKKWIISPTVGSASIWNTLLGWNDEGEYAYMREFKERIEIFSDGRTYAIWVRWNFQWKFELHYLGTTWKWIKAYDIH